MRSRKPPRLHLAAIVWPLTACNFSLLGSPQPVTPPAAPEPIVLHKDGVTPVCVKHQDPVYEGWMVPPGAYLCEPPVEFHADGIPVCTRGPGGTPNNPPGYDSCVPSTEYLQEQVTRTDNVPLLEAAEYLNRLQMAVAIEDWGFAAVALLELRLVDPGNTKICEMESVIRKNLRDKALAYQRELIKQAEQRATEKQAFIEQQEAISTPDDHARESLRRGLEALERGDTHWWIQMNIATPEQLWERGEMMEMMALHSPDGRRIQLSQWSRSAGIDPAERYPGLPVHLVLACIQSEQWLANSTALGGGADSSRHAALCVPQRQSKSCP